MEENKEAKENKGVQKKTKGFHSATSWPEEKEEKGEMMEYKERRVDENQTQQRKNKECKGE